MCRIGTLMKGHGLADSENKQKLAFRTARAIGAEVVISGWPVGEVIGSEADLLSRYNVSRAVLREAIRILENQGVADMRRGPGGGLAVTEPNAESLVWAAALLLDFEQTTDDDLMQARLGIELMAVDLAAKRIDEAGIHWLRAELANEHSRNPNAEYEHTRGVHVAIAEIAGNPVLVLFAKILVALTETQFSPSSDTPLAVRSDLHEMLHRDHGNIVEAIASGDAALGAHYMRNHFQQILEWRAAYPNARPKADLMQIASRAL